MASIGKFGTSRPQAEEGEPDTFEWYGSSIRLQTRVNQVRLIDMMDVARSVDSESPAAVAIVKDMFRMIINVDDFDGFWSAAADNWVETDELVELSQVLMAAITDRPTQRQPDSSPGLPQTPVSLPVDFSSVVSVGPVEEAPHRPDLVLLQQGGQATREQLNAAARRAAVG